MTDLDSRGYNTRTALGYNDGERAALLVLGAEGKRAARRVLTTK